MCFLTNRIKNNESLVNITNIFYLCCIGRMEWWNNGRLGREEECLPCELRRRSYFYRGLLERLSELVSENLISRLWEGLWERIMLKVCEFQRLLLTFNF